MDSARNCLVLHILVAVSMAVLIAPALADDFHVENKMYYPSKHEKHPKPVETTTLFASGRVYDFMKAPDETVVFDPGRDLVVLLDPNRQMKTQITTGDISSQISMMREAAQNHKTDAVREAVTAKFAESVDPRSGILKLTNRWMQYEIETTAPERPQVAKQYADYADWQVQLNAILNPPTLPFPRLAVNKVLRQRQELPVKVKLTLTPEKRTHDEIVIRSEHTILMALSKEDRERIEEAGQQMHMFADVGFDAYHQIKNQAQAEAEASLRR